jgi:hypothetical protein
MNNAIATLHLNSWAGHSTSNVEILKETPKRFKIKLLKDCLKGKSGKILYVPKYAVSNIEDDTNEHNQN